MAKVRNNIVMKGLSGSLGDQLVIKMDKGGRTIVSVKPTFPGGRTFNPAQVEQQEAFKQASTYAKSSKGEAAYAEKAKGTPMNAYNVAMADWFHAPEIIDINLSAWNGQIGQVIRIQAEDDVKVKMVTVVITDNTDAIIEQGSAVLAADGWWEYTTTNAANDNPKVIASAQDLPGHITQMTTQM